MHTAKQINVTNFIQQHKQHDEVIMKNIKNRHAITQQTMKKCHNITTTTKIRMLHNTYKQ